MYQFDPQASCRVEALGVDTSTTSGTVVQSNNTWVSIGTAGFTYECLHFCFDNLTTITAYLRFDIGIYDGTDTWPIAEGLTVQNPAAYDQDDFNLPLHVPAGSQLRVRCNAALTTHLPKVIIQGYSQNYNGAPGYARCKNLTPGTTALPTVSATTAHTKATTAIVTTAEDFKAFMLKFRGGTASRTYIADLQAASQVIYTGIDREGTLARLRASPVLNYPVASGTQMSISFQCSATTSTLAYGLYGFQ